MTLLDRPVTTEDFAMPLPAPEPDDALLELFASLEKEIRGLRLGCRGIVALCDESLNEGCRLPEADWDDQSENGRRLSYYVRQVETLRTHLNIFRYVLREQLDDPAGKREEAGQYGRPAIPEEYVVR